LPAATALRKVLPPVLPPAVLPVEPVDGVLGVYVMAPLGEVLRWL
jgi:hypothetical protein